MSKQCNGVPSQNPRHRSSGTPTSIKHNQRSNEKENNQNVQQDILSPIRRHSSSQNQNKRVSNDPARTPAIRQKKNSEKYKKTRSTSASRIQHYGYTNDDSRDKTKSVDGRWWNDQINIKGGSGLGLSQTGRGRSRILVGSNNSLAERRKTDNRVHEFQVYLLIRVLDAQKYSPFWILLFYFHLIVNFIFYLVIARLLATAAKWSTKY